MISPKTTYDASSKIWSGPEKKIGFEGYSSLGPAIFENMKKHPEHIFQISDTDGISLTNQEILTMSIRIAQRLEIEEGSIIGIMSIGSTYQASVLIAAFLRGIIFHQIGSSFDQKTTQHILGITRPKIIFCDAENHKNLIAACKKINLKPKIYTIKGQIEGVDCLQNLMEATGIEDEFRPRKCKQDDTAVIIGSSGTTGLPKGVCISNKTILNRIAHLPFRRGVLFTSTNVCYISGLVYFVFSALCGVTRICTEDQYSPQMLRQLIEKYEINIIRIPASEMSTFIKSGEAELWDCSSVESFVVGGLNVSHPMYVKMQECLKKGILYISYGGTEFGRVARNCTIKKPKSVGQICIGVKVRIVDEDGNNLGIGETGEVLVWNNIPWSGYYGNATESQTMLDSDGWFHTGDIGLFDEDGDLNLIDRKKEIMRYQGFQFSAQEIENCILLLSEIVEVCVFATTADELGDLATAAVIKKSGSSLTEKEIIDHVAKELSQPMWLHGGVYFVENIPQTPSGKFQRFKIRDMCLGNEIIF